MNKPLLLLLLISFNTYPIHKQLTEKERFELAQQKEKDDQEYRLAILKVVGTVSLMIISALVKIYLQNRDK